MADDEDFEVVPLEPEPVVNPFRNIPEPVRTRLQELIDPNSEEERSQADPPYAAIDDGVKIRLGVAYDYLNEMFITHHYTEECFKNNSDFLTYRKLANILWRANNGQWVMTWTAFDILMVSKLMFKQWKDLIDETYDIDQMVYLYLANGAVVLNVPNYNAPLPEPYMTRLHKKVSKHVLKPKLDKAGQECLAFFGGARLKELDKFPYVHNGDIIANVKELIDDLKSRIDNVGKLYAKEGRGICFGPDDELLGDSFVFSPPALEMLCKDIHFACCQAEKDNLLWKDIDFNVENYELYNVRELAPYLQQSLFPDQRTEATRGDHQPVMLSAATRHELAGLGILDDVLALVKNALE